MSYHMRGGRPWRQFHGQEQMEILAARILRLPFLALIWLLSLIRARRP